MPRTFAVSEIARLRGVTLQHIYNMLRAGRIPGAKKVGGLWRIPASAAEGRKQSHAAAGTQR